MAQFTLKWDTQPALKRILDRVKPSAKKPLYRKLQFIMLSMVGEHHRHGGTKQRWAKPWTWANHWLRDSWRLAPNKPQIYNNRRWATDFYYGHGYRKTYIKPYYRRIRRPTKFGASMKGRHPAEYVGKRAMTRTVAITRVKGHYRRIRPRPAHEIWWTRRYVKRAEKAILEHVLK